MKKILFILVLFLIIGGCDQTKNSWIKAKQTNSVSEVKKFLEENPNSEYDMVAKNLLDSLEWIEAKQSNSVIEVKKFLEENPNSEYDMVAKNLLDSLEWIKAQKNNTVDSYNLFISNYPKSKYNKNALCSLDSIEWFFALNSGDSKAMLKYLKRLNIHKVNSLSISSNGYATANGHYTGCFKGGDGKLIYIGGGPVEIIIFKDLIGWSKERIEKHSLKAGEAQIWVNDSVIARKPIDIKQTEKDFCTVFGVPYGKIY